MRDFGNILLRRLTVPFVQKIVRPAQRRFSSLRLLPSPFFHSFQNLRPFLSSPDIGPQPISHPAPAQSTGFRPQAGTLLKSRHRSFSKLQAQRFLQNVFFLPSRVLVLFARMPMDAAFGFVIWCVFISARSFALAFKRPFSTFLDFSSSSPLVRARTLDTQCRRFLLLPHSAPLTVAMRASAKFFAAFFPNRPS